MTKVQFIRAQLRSSLRAKGVTASAPPWPPKPWRRRQRFNASLAAGASAKQATLQPPAAFTLKQRERASAFTLVELLIVMGIIGLLLFLIAPVFTNIKGGNDVTSAAYTIKSVLDTARTYAKANNTYTWVGFYEEDVSRSSTNPATPGPGRLVMSIVASKDGTMLYPIPLAAAFTLDASPNQAALTQVGKLVKIDNVHLTTFALPTQTPPPLDTFATRPTPAVTAQIGDSTPSTPYLIFRYPAGSSSPQYTFIKIVQFSPHGEGVVDNSNYFQSGANLAPISEIGIEPTHGAAVPSSTPADVVAIQFTGLGGDVKIYRR